jgi:hypothetical protein
MTHFFKTLGFVALNLTLLVLSGCGVAQSRTNYIDTPTTTVTYFPSVTTTTFQYVNTALSCSISANATAVVPGKPVDFTVTASNGVSTQPYQFGNINLDFNSSVPLKPDAAAVLKNKATASYPYPSAGQYVVQTTVSKGSENASCVLSVNVQSLALTVTALNSNFVGTPGGLLTLVANPLGFDGSKPIYYQFYHSEPNIRVMGNGGSISVQALDSSVHRSFNLTIRAYTDFQTFADASVKVAFLPPLECRFSLVGSPNVNTDLTLTVYSRNPLTGHSSGEELVITAGDVPDLTVTDVQDSQGNFIGNVKTLRFAKKGPYAPYFTVHSPLRNADCTFLSSGVFSQILTLTNDFDKNGKAIFTVY